MPSMLGAVGLFIVALLAFVVESQLTQYVQADLGYRQPFFLFYLVHSSFAIIFPLHLAYLLLTTTYSARALLTGLAYAIARHLDPARSSALAPFPRAKFARLVLALTLGITCPALLWFLAISLASVTDVTAIWNTNAFFAYLISLRLLHLPCDARHLLAVVLATLGTVAVVYGSSSSSSPPSKSLAVLEDAPFKPTAPLLGNLITLLASFGYGLYQVLYKIYAALPSDPDAAELYHQIPDAPDTDPNTDADPEPPRTHTRTTTTTTTHHDHAGIHPPDMIHPPPFGLYPNLLTSLLGFTTFLLLWLPLPFLHWSGAEPFRLPPTLLTTASIAAIALSGVIFNAGFMVLLGIWGPIIVSVGNLLTIVLVLISDLIFGGGLQVLTVSSLLGSGVIVLAFSVLAYDMFTK